MILSLIRSLNAGAELRDIIPRILFTIIVVVFSLSLHETAHAFAAYKLGDPTARNMGRMTLNPARHLDPFGAICMMLFGFGWAKPVPINSRNFNNPRKGIAISSAAGPASNLLLSLVSLLLFYVTIIFLRPVFGELFTLVPEAATPFYYSPSYILSVFSQLSIEVSIADKILLFLADLLAVFHILNLYLAVFNLLPVPPLDGSKILYMFLPSKIYYKIQRYEQIIYFVLIALLITGGLSGILSTVCMHISNAMTFVVKLIPGL